MLPSLLGGAECFNNEIHHCDWIPVVQADVKAVSRPFPALGLGLACETNSRPCAYSMLSVSKFSIAILGVVLVNNAAPTYYCLALHMHMKKSCLILKHLRYNILALVTKLSPMLIHLKNNILALGIHLKNKYLPLMRNINKVYRSNQHLKIKIPIVSPIVSLQINITGVTST